MVPPATPILSLREQYNLGRKNRNANLEAKQMIWSADMFTIVFPAQENGIEEKMR